MLFKRILKSMAATGVTLLLITGCGSSDSSSPAPAPQLRFLWPSDGYVMSGPLLVEAEATAVDSVTLKVGPSPLDALTAEPYTWNVDEGIFPAGQFPIRLSGVGEGGMAEETIWIGYHYGRMPVPGDRCPDFRLPDPDGEVHLYSEVRAGRPALLNFWASWCPPCVHEMPDLQSIHDDYSGQGFHVLGCAVLEDSTHSNAFIRQADISFDMLVDPEDNTYIYYRINAIPRTFLLDAEGVVRHSFLGAIDPDVVRPLVEELLAEVKLEASSP